VNEGWKRVVISQPTDARRARLVRDTLSILPDDVARRCLRAHPLCAVTDTCGTTLMIDRLSLRSRPAGRPLLHQTWDRLLFLHWSLPPERLRPLVPPRLALDTFAGDAWIGLTPFTMWGIRPTFLPPLPWLSASHELNVRTYVHVDGVPGVWFFSLDASNLFAVVGARLGYHLPYFWARMTLHEEGPTIHYTSHRIHWGARPADFEAVWTRGAPLPEAEPETLTFFLLERYCLYAARGAHLYRARIAHRPWPVCRATLSRLSSTMLAALGLPTPTGEPLLHSQAAPLSVDIWPPQRI
jgi:uncharacterized protein YqjF (DUF2071 family)